MNSFAQYPVISQDSLEYVHVKSDFSFWIRFFQNNVQIKDCFEHEYRVTLKDSGNPLSYSDYNMIIENKLNFFQVVKLFTLTHIK